MIDLSLMPVIGIVLAVLGLGLLVQHWLQVERARYIEITRRERLRILLRPEDPRK